MASLDKFYLSCAKTPNILKTPLKTLLQPPHKAFLTINGSEPRPFFFYSANANIVFFVS